MTFKVFLVFLILAVHASNQSPPLRDDSIKQILVQVFSDILEKTGQALEHANKIIDDTQANQVEITQEIIDAVVGGGHTLNEIFLAFVNGLRKGATLDGQSIIDCVNLERNKTEAAFEEVSAIVGYCAANEIDVVLNQTRSILSHLGDLQNDVQAQTDALQTCDGNDFICIIPFLATGVAIIAKIPDVLIQDIAEVSELIEKVIDDMSQCDISSTILKRTQEIFNEGVVCINN